MEKTMTGDISVIKRSGKSEPLDINKLHVMVEAACEGLAGVSVSQVEMNSKIQFFDGITTEQIQKILVNSASNLIDLDHPNYQFVAARLMLFANENLEIELAHWLITYDSLVFACSLVRTPRLDTNFRNDNSSFCCSTCICSLVFS